MTNQEREIEQALSEAGIRYVPEWHDSQTTRHLDFYLPDYDVYLEAKAFYSSRVRKQLSRADNVIVVQGVKATHLIIQLLQQGAKQ